MSPAQLDWLRQVTLREGYEPGPTQRRYARALALNGQPGVAARQLQILRRIWGERAYAQARAQVEALAATKYPELRQLSLP
jgi:hypothetical protein